MDGSRAASRIQRFYCQWYQQVRGGVQSRTIVVANGQQLIGNSLWQSRCSSLLVEMLRDAHSRAKVHGPDFSCWAHLAQISSGRCFFSGSCGKVYAHGGKVGGDDVQRCGCARIGNFGLTGRDLNHEHQCQRDLVRGERRECALISTVMAVASNLVVQISEFNWAVSLGYRFCFM